MFHTSPGPLSTLVVGTDDGSCFVNSVPGQWHAGKPVPTQTHDS